MDTKHPFLSSLGITDLDQARDPTVSTFPHAFNPSCQRIWNAVVSNMEFKPASAGHNWATAIRLFVEVCIAEDEFPFSNLKQSSNDFILEALSNARKDVVKFLNRSKLLDLVNLRATRREVSMMNTGFVLKVFGNAWVKDPTFEKWLIQIPYPRFDLKEHGQYRKQVSPSTTMIVYNEGASLNQRWHIGYEIVVHQFPDLPGNTLASKGDMEKFILDILWMPVLRSHRPFGYHKRLI